MVAASMDASVEVVVIVAHLYRHPQGRKVPSSEGFAVDHLWLTAKEEVRENSGVHPRGTKYQSRTHGPTRTSFHDSVHRGCTACIAAKTDQTQWSDAVFVVRAAMVPGQGNKLNA